MGAIYKKKFARPPSQGQTLTLMVALRCLLCKALKYDPLRSASGAGDGKICKKMFVRPPITGSNPDPDR